MTVDLTPHNDRPAEPLPPSDVPPLEGAVAPDVVTPDDALSSPEATEAQVRRLLSLIGLGAHTLAGHPDIGEHWAFTDGELDALTPPMTSYINRSRRLRAAVERGDLVTVAVTLGLYVERNVSISREIAAVEFEDAADAQVEPDAGDPTLLQPFGSL